MKTVAGVSMPQQWYLQLIEETLWKYLGHPTFKNAVLITSKITYALFFKEKPPLLFAIKPNYLPINYWFEYPDFFFLFTVYLTQVSINM